MDHVTSPQRLQYIHVTIGQLAQTEESDSLVLAFRIWIQRLDVEFNLSGWTRRGYRAGEEKVRVLSEYDTNKINSTD